MNIVHNVSMERNTNQITLDPTSVYECPLELKKITRCARLVHLFGVEPPGGPQTEWEAVAMEAMIACLMSSKEQCFLASVQVRPK